MATGFVIRRNQYYDSVFLMSVNRRISEVKGVQQAAVLMGSSANKLLLKDLGIQNDEIEAAQPNDLIVAVVAETPDRVEDVLGRLGEFLEAGNESAPSLSMKTLEEGLSQKPNVNLAVISVPGEYAGKEAKKALEAGLNVFLFSDNVSIEDELELKQYATTHGLLVMGPDCGTSLIGGVGLGFANIIRPGPIGVIGGAGTGLQEFTSQVHNAGSGISHAIGTGSHDLSEKIGGLTTLAALEELEADKQTRVIAIISKRPASGSLAALFDRVEKGKKPVVGCFLGIDTGIITRGTNIHLARTIDEAVRNAINLSAGQEVVAVESLTHEELDMIRKEKKTWSPEQKYLRGILAGGTFCYQSQQMLREAGYSIFSNSLIDRNYLLADPEQSIEHTIIDMGDDYFTVGKPHPMFDGTERKRRIMIECRDPRVAVLYLDFILGYNASRDPVGEMLDGILEAKRIFKQRGGNLTIVASVCGTENDPQNIELQIKKLREAGALVFRSNALATAAISELLRK